MNISEQRDESQNAAIALRIQDIVQVEPQMLFRLIPAMKYDVPQSFRYMGKLQPLYNAAEVQFLVKSKINKKEVQDYLYTAFTGDSTPTLDKYAQSLLNLQDEIFSYYYKSEILRFSILRLQELQKLLFPYVKRFENLREKKVKTWESVNPTTDLGFVLDNVETLKQGKSEISKINAGYQKAEDALYSSVGFKSSNITEARSKINAAKIAVKDALEKNYDVLEDKTLFIDLEEFFNANDINMFYADTAYKLLGDDGDYHVTSQLLAEIIIEKQELPVINSILKHLDLFAYEIPFDWLQQLKEQKEQYIEKLIRNKTDAKIFRMGTQNVKKILSGLISYANGLSPDMNKKSIFG